MNDNDFGNTKINTQNKDSDEQEIQKIFDSLNNLKDKSIINFIDTDIPIINIIDKDRKHLNKK